MKLKKITALFLSLGMTVSMLAGCGGGAAAPTGGSDTAAVEEDTGAKEDTVEEESDEAASNGEITEFTMFAAMPEAEINDDNEIQQIIAEKTGVKVKETWLTGQTDAEAIGTFIAGGDLPDYINGGDSMMALYDADVLVPWDDYLDKYPNLKEMYSDEEWESFRQEDGHIYWANVFQNTYGESKATTHNDEAFWIQAKVLEWAGYPKIETLDDYFKVLEDYAEENPTLEDGTEVIPYTALCEDWRYFCIENAPEFLDGYPNDGSVIVDVENMKIVDYNTTATAKMYFNKLNEEYAKGIIDPEFATQTYDEYIAKLSTGRVLGMCDQWWDFAYTVNDVFKTTGLDLEGCNYVPLGLVAEAGMEQQWHTYGDTLNNSSGVAITTNCEDVDKAFQFLNDVLDQEIHDLRFWGVEGVDYLIDDDGMYYRTEEMRAKWADTEYQASHECKYSYLPQWLGTSRDGKNAMQPTEQTSEFFDSLAEPLVKCFEAYDVKTYPEMIGSVEKELGPWFPMYSFSNAMTTETPGGVAWTKIGETKHEWLPKVVMAANFESEWESYMEAYNACNPQDFLDEMQEELDRRAGN
ncbi:MAG: sugar ABC transporter substrate-binding protein [Lachnospiraceae bacterium]|nr:sugar ABC transporter substrate-binding protein [Lachnospiraceae bacterium]